MMRDALLADLSQLPYEVLTTVDVRLPSPANCQQLTTIQPGDDVWSVWENIIKTVDAVWLIAPETEGILIQLSNLAVKHHKVIIGSGLAALHIASSKLATYEALRQAGVDTVPSYTPSNWSPNNEHQWLVKQDDGAGCEALMIFDGAMALQYWLSDNEQQDSFIIQPYLEGIHGSISCIMHQGDAVVLSANTQVIHQKNKQLIYQGNIINGLQDFWAQFTHTAKQVAQAIPDLTGYVGIDVIVDAQSASVVVVEVNPRLTLSYCGLREAIGANPAKLVIDYLTTQSQALPILHQRQVAVSAEALDG